MTARPGQLRLRVIPCSVRQANDYIAEVHRHHGPVPTGMGAKISMAVVDEDSMVRGVAIVSRTLGGNRMPEGSSTAEVARVATDGCPNACSALYAAAARMARIVGYSRIVTYILDTESGTSLKAAGWAQDPGWYGGVSWIRHGGRDLRPMGPKGRWSLKLSEHIEPTWPAAVRIDAQLSLVDEGG